MQAASSTVNSSLQQPAVFQSDRIRFIADDAFHHMGTLPSQAYDCVVLADVPNVAALVRYRPLAKQIARIVSRDGVVIVADRADVSRPLSFAGHELRLIDAYDCTVDGTHTRYLVFSPAAARNARAASASRHAALASRGALKLRDVVRDLASRHGCRFYEPFAGSPAIAAACVATRVSYEAHYRSAEALNSAKTRFLEVAKRQAA